MSDTNNFDDFEKIQVLLKSALNVPSTHEDLPWYSETKGKYDFILEADSINANVVPDIPSWDTSNKLDTATVSELYGLSDADFASSSDGDFPRLQTSNDSGGYSTSVNIAPGVYPDTTGLLHLFVRLNLNEALSANTNSLAYTKYNGSTQILSNSFQFNYKAFDDTDAGQILPYNYTVEYRYLNGSSYEYDKMDFLYGNWSFDFKSGIVSFSDDPTTDGNYDIVTDRTNDENNLYFTFVKYVGPRGLDKLISVSDTFDSTVTSDYYENQIVVDSTNSEIYLLKNGSWNSIGGGGSGGGGAFTIDGNNAYYNSGNVGIGNTSPSSTLDVTGTANISSTLTVEGRLITQNVSTTNGFYGSQWGSKLLTANTLTDATYGNYSHPIIACLENSSASQGQELFFKTWGYNASASGTDANRYGSSLHIGFNGQTLHPGTPESFCLYYVNNNESVLNITGSIGINTLNPSYSLDVTGTANISSTLTVGDNSSFSYDVANDYDFIVWGTTRMNYGVTIGGENGLDGGLTITNMSTTYGYETVIIQSDIDGGGLQENSAGRSYQNTSNDSRKLISIQPYGGTVGIGTSTPSSSYKLDVAGNINFTGNLYQNGSAVSFETSSGSSGSSVFSLNGSDAYYDSGNIGIGNTSPSSTLDVTGTANISSTLTVNPATMGQTGYDAKRRFLDFTHFQTTNNSTNTEPIVNISTMSTYNGPYFSIGENSGSDNGNPVTSTIGNKFLVNSDGNVGINTISPTSLLRVYDAPGTDTTMPTVQIGQAGTYSKIMATHTDTFTTGNTVSAPILNVHSDSYHDQSVIATFSRGDSVFEIAAQGIFHTRGSDTTGQAIAQFKTGSNVTVVGDAAWSSNFAFGPSKIVAQRGIQILDDVDTATLQTTTNTTSSLSYLLTVGGSGYFESGLRVLGGSTANSFEDNVVFHSNIGSGQTTYNSTKIVLRSDNGNFYGAEILGGGIEYNTSADDVDDLTNADYFGINKVAGGGKSRHFSLNRDNGARFDCNVSIIGDLNFTGNLYQNGSSVSFETTSEYGGNSIFSLNGTNAYYNSGSVGIGNTSPSYTLDVTGNGRFTSGLVVEGNITMNGTDFKMWNSTRGGGSDTSNGRALVHSSTDSSNYSKDASILVINYSGDYGAGTRMDSNLGVGGRSPSYTLDVAGDARIDSDLTMSGNLITTSIQGYNQVDIYSNQTWQDSAGWLELRSGATNLAGNMVSLYAGTVQNDTGENGSVIATATTTGFGIFTTTPTCALDVAGDASIVNIHCDYIQVDNIKMGSGGILKLGGTNYWNITKPSDETVMRFNAYFANQTDGLEYFDFYNSNASESIMVINNAGNVGIGTTSPNYNLDINGTVGIGTDLTVGGNTNMNAFLDFGTVGGGIIFRDDSMSSTGNPFLIARTGGSQASPNTTNSATYIDMTQNTVDIGSSTSSNLLHSSNYGGDVGTIGLTVNSSGTQITDDLTVGGTVK